MEKLGIILVLGGARSGKSYFAERMAQNSGLEVVYVATSEVRDEEMALRVKKHRDRRPAHWRTVEEPLAPEEEISKVAGPSKIILFDCITLWVSNLLLHRKLPYPGAGTDEKEKYILKKIEKLLELLRSNNTSAILVSNEVGWGIVPENYLARTYRDIIGRVNQLCARYASRVYLTVAGLPVEIKSLAVELPGTGTLKGGAEYDC